MTLARIHDVVTFLVAGLGLLALSLGQELSPIVLAAIWGTFVAAMFLDGSRPTVARARLLTILLGGVLAVLVVLTFLGGSIFSAAIELGAALQLARLLHRPSAREHLQIMVLSFAHLAAATALSSGLDFAALFIAYVIATPWMLVLCELRARIEQHFGVASEQQALALSRKRVVSAGLLVGTAALGLPLFASTALLFLLFPRVGAGVLTFGDTAARRTSGFGDTVDLGAMGEIAEDDSVAMRLRFAAPQAGEHVDVYLRGTSFDVFDGTRWGRSDRANQAIVESAGEHIVAPQVAPQPVYVRVELEPLDVPIVFVPPETVAVSIPVRLENGLRVDRRLYEGTGGELRYQDDDGLGLRYDVRLGGPGEGLGRFGDPDRYLATPELPAVRALALRVVGDARTPEQKIERLTRFLRDSGEYRYTLSGESGGERPLERFLFETKAGHCEFFATALAVMLRMVGVPARNVAGFRGATRNAYGDYYVVRQRDAHTWVEAFVRGSGFVTADPTPAAIVALRPNVSPMAGLLDAMRSRWFGSIVEYDMVQQIEYLQDAARAMRRMRRGDQHVPQEIYVVLALIALCVAGVIAYRLISRVRVTRSQEERRVTRLYRALERKLARHGVARPASRTAEEHLESVKSKAPWAAAITEEITTVYLAGRFGRARIEPARMSELESRVRHMAPPH